MRVLSSIRRALARFGRRALRADALVLVAFLVGLALVAVGVGLIYAPAGLIVAGVEMTGAAALYERGGGA